MALPHPVRTDAAFGTHFNTALFEEIGLLARLRAYLADEAVCSEWILNRFAGMRDLALADLGMPGSFNRAASC